MSGGATLSVLLLPALHLSKLELVDGDVFFRQHPRIDECEQITELLEELGILLRLLQQQGGH